MPMCKQQTLTLKSFLQRILQKITTMVGLMTLNLKFCDVNSDNALGNLIGLMIEYFRVLLIFYKYIL